MNKTSSPSKSWREFRSPDRCPICKHLGRCKRSSDGGAVLCFRVEDGAFRECRGGIAWLHRLDDNRMARHTRPDLPTMPAEPERADDDTLARVYAALLGRLTLSRNHRIQLYARGFSYEAIDRNGYRTLPDEPGRWPVALALVERFGADALRTPGLVVRQSKRTGRPYATIAGRPGLLIPYRDHQGRVLGFQVRPDEPGTGGKYVWLSGCGGPRNASRAHLPSGSPSHCEQVILTEGALKADLAFCLSGWPMVAIAGVDVWAVAVPTLSALGARRVLLGFDMDLTSNPNVARSVGTAALGLTAAGFTVGVLSWDAGDGKGLDNLLVRQLLGRREKPAIFTTWFDSHEGIHP